MTPPLDMPRPEDFLPGPMPLHSLLARCVVRLDGDGEFRGTGFFVAPGEILTCAHVVHRCTTITATWEGGSSSAMVVAALPDLPGDDRRAQFYPYPDVAVLRLDEPPPGCPCVRLDAAAPAVGPPADVLMTIAWTMDEYRPETAELTTATFEYEGPLRPTGELLLKLKNGQVAHGFSGGPLVNLRTGGVCAAVDSTRDSRSDLGGFGVPLSGFLSELAGIDRRNQEFHIHDDRWSRAVEEERVARATREGQAGRLPLVPPLRELAWDVDGSRAELLHPRYGVVPYLGRDELLANLMLWREHQDPLRVAVISAAGGFGKTRTAVEVCAAAARAGWTAGLFTESVARPFAGLDALATWPGRLVIAVDYAETRPPGAIAELLRSLATRPSYLPTRVLLLMRVASTRDDLRELLATGDERLELERLAGTAELVRLDRDVPEVDRGELFSAACAALAPLLGRPVPSHIPDLAGEHFGRPLFVLAAALLCAADTEVDVAGLGADDVLGAVLDRHEAEYWDRWNLRLGTGLSRAQQRSAVALAALLGAETEAEALELAGMLPWLGEAPYGSRYDVASWLAHLYGSGRLTERPAIRRLEPDLLAEVLVARELVTGEPD